MKAFEQQVKPTARITMKTTRIGIDHWVDPVENTRPPTAIIPPTTQLTHNLHPIQQTCMQYMAKELHAQRHQRHILQLCESDSGEDQSVSGPTNNT